MADAKTIAEDFTAMLRAGQFDEAGEKYWAADVRSIEAGDLGGMGAVAHGIEALRAKGAWWYANNEIRDFTADGPYMNGDQFILKFTMTIVNKATGEGGAGDEMALYTVRDGKIVEERFFYG